MSEHFKNNIERQMRVQDSEKAKKEIISAREEAHRKILEIEDEIKRTFEDLKETSHHIISTSGRIQKDDYYPDEDGQNERMNDKADLTYDERFIEALKKDILNLQAHQKQVHELIKQLDELFSEIEKSSDELLADMVSASDSQIS